MLSRLARHLGLAALIASLATAPVLAATPRCCNTGAIAGGGNCCCRVESEPLEIATPANESTCEEQAPRSCCAHSEPAIEAPEAAQLAIDSRCGCQIQAPLPALPGSDRAATRHKQSLVVVLPPEADDVAAVQIIQTRVAAQAEPPPSSLHKKYCRWTV